MPCDSIVLNSVELKTANEQLLGVALKAIGATNVTNIRTGSVRFRVDYRDYEIVDGKLVGDERTVGEMSDRIKREYSNAAVGMAAKRFGWITKKTATGKVEISRRF